MFCIGAKHRKAFYIDTPGFLQLCDRISSVRTRLPFSNITTKSSTEMFINVVLKEESNQRCWSFTWLLCPVQLPLNYRYICVSVMLSVTYSCGSGVHIVILQLCIEWKQKTLELGQNARSQNASQWEISASTVNWVMGKYSFCCFAGFPLLILAVDTEEIETEGIRADVVAPFNVAY